MVDKVRQIGGAESHAQRYEDKTEALVWLGAGILEKIQEGEAEFRELKKDPAISKCISEILNGLTNNPTPSRNAERFASDLAQRVMEFAKNPPNTDDEEAPQKHEQAKRVMRRLGLLIVQDEKEEKLIERWKKRTEEQRKNKPYLGAALALINGDIPEGIDRIKPQVRWDVLEQIGEMIWEQEGYGKAGTPQALVRALIKNAIEPLLRLSSTELHEEQKEGKLGADIVVRLRTAYRMSLIAALHRSEAGRHMKLMDAGKLGDGQTRQKQTEQPPARGGTLSRLPTREIRRDPLSTPPQNTDEQEPTPSSPGGTSLPFRLHVVPDRQ